MFGKRIGFGDGFQVNRSLSGGDANRVVDNLILIESGLGQHNLDPLNVRWAERTFADQFAHAGTRLPATQLNDKQQEDYHDNGQANTRCTRARAVPLGQFLSD